jgi:predicted nucleic acid-binding protein
MRVVFDTNVFVSAFVVPGSQASAPSLSRGRAGSKLYTSVAILTETAGRLRTKFAQDADDIKAALKQISRAARDREAVAQDRCRPG